MKNQIVGILALILVAFSITSFRPEPAPVSCGTATATVSTTASGPQVHKVGPYQTYYVHVFGPGGIGCLQSNAHYTIVGGSGCNDTSPSGTILGEITTDLAPCGIDLKFKIDCTSPYYDMSDPTYYTIHFDPFSIHTCQ